MIQIGDIFPNPYPPLFWSPAQHLCEYKYTAHLPSTVMSSKYQEYLWITSHLPTALTCDTTATENASLMIQHVPPCALQPCQAQGCSALRWQRSWCYRCARNVGIGEVVSAVSGGGRGRQGVDGKGQTGQWMRPAHMEGGTMK